MNAQIGVTRTLCLCGKGVPAPAEHPEFGNSLGSNCLWHWLYAVFVGRLLFYRSETRSWVAPAHRLEGACERTHASLGALEGALVFAYLFDVFYKHTLYKRLEAGRVEDVS
jgi:hypothetical protein